jgi:hypothetical protein
MGNTSSFEVDPIDLLADNQPYAKTKIKEYKNLKAKLAQLKKNKVINSDISLQYRTCRDDLIRMLIDDNKLQKKVESMSPSKQTLLKSNLEKVLLIFYGAQYLKETSHNRIHEFSQLATTTLANNKELFLLFEKAYTILGGDINAFKQKNSAFIEKETKSFVNGMNDLVNKMTPKKRIAQPSLDDTMKMIDKMSKGVYKLIDDLYKTVAKYKCK